MNKNCSPDKGAKRRVRETMNNAWLKSLLLIVSLDQSDKHIMNSRSQHIGKTESKYAFHPMVWILILGVLLVRMGTSLSVPFITLFLHEKAGLSFLHTGLIVSASFIAYVVGGFVGGALSDRYGRLPLIIFALAAYSSVFFAFGFFGTRIHIPYLLGIIFACLNLIAGVSRSWTETLGQALIADLTQPEQKRSAFSLRYTSANIGNAVGPLMGAWLGFSGSMAGFYLTGSLLFIYFCIYCFAMIRYQNILQSHDVKLTEVSFKNACAVLIRDKAMAYFVLGGVLVYFGFVQQEVSFAIIILKNTHSTHIFSLLLFMNALIVILLQMPIVKLLEKYSPLPSMMIGAILIAIGLGGIAGASDHQWIYFLSEFIFTVGEILVFPFTGIFIDSLAPAKLRGTYFGAAGLQYLGRAVGPILAGLLMQQMGGSLAMIIIAVIELFSVVCFVQGYKAVNQKTSVITLERQEAH